MKKWITCLVLLGVFAIALCLRLVLLSTLPNGLHQDELNAGYQGYLLIRTGHDLYGNFLPAYINRFGDFRPAGIFYFTGLFTAFFGLTTFFIRFPTAILGALTIVPVYFLTKRLSGSVLLACLAGFFIAVSPWHIVLSRATSEQIVALFCIIWAAFFLLLALDSGKKREYLFSLIAFGISYFFYHTPRVFIPVFLLLFALTATYYPSLLSLKKRIPLKSMLWGVTACMVGLTIALSLTTAGRGRLDQTSVWADQAVSSKIRSLSDAEKGNVVNARLFDNKVVIYGRTILNHYLDYFSVDYLFVQGGLPDRYVVPEMGLLYYIEFPLLLLGCYFLLQKKDRYFLLPILWLATAPLAAALTTEDIPNVARTVFMLPAFQILEAYGAYYGLKAVQKKWRYFVGGISAVLLLLNIIYFWHMYVVVSPSHVSYRRDDGNQSLFTYLRGQEKKYQAIYLSSSQDLPLYYRYYIDNPIQMVTYKADVDKGFHIGKYYFVRDECPQKILPSSVHRENALIVDFGNCAKDNNLTQLTTITRQDSTTAYILYTTGQK